MTTGTWNDIPAKELNSVLTLYIVTHNALENKQCISDFSTEMPIIASVFFPPLILEEVIVCLSQKAYQQEQHTSKFVRQPARKFQLDGTELRAC